jgi:hypothetical protein
MCFFVYSGRVIVEVAGNKFGIAKGGLWQVPRGTLYLPFRDFWNVLSFRSCIVVAHGGTGDRHHLLRLAYRSTGTQAFPMQAARRNWMFWLRMPPTTAVGSNTKETTSGPNGTTRLFLIVLAATRASPKEAPSLPDAATPKGKLHVECTFRCRDRQNWTSGREDLDAAFGGRGTTRREYRQCYRPSGTARSRC